MTRLRLALLALVAAAFLAAPLSAFCSSCCGSDTGKSVFSAPTCCDDTCGPSLTTARPRDPALAVPKTRLDPPISTAAFQTQAVELLAATPCLAGNALPAPTESPPVSRSVLRL